MKGLRGKVAVVTGGAAGIGRASAQRLAAEGARVVVVDRDEELTAATMAELPGDHLAVVTDASTEVGIETFMAAALQEFGSVDLAHLNIGVSHRHAPVADLDVDEIDQVLRVTLRSNVLGLRAVLAQLVHQGSGGSVVVTSSIGGTQGGPEASAYSTAKHGLIGLVRSTATEYGPHRIRINALCPGFTDTALVRADLGSDSTGIAQRAALEASIPAGRLADPAEIGSAAAWLLSDESSYVSGTALVVDGGYTSSLTTPQRILTTTDGD